jgi:hypothetical protein
MDEIPAEATEYLALLAATPRRIEAAIQGHAAEALHLRPDDKTWSASDILAHLRASVDVWGEEARTILAEHNPTIRHLSPRTWIRKTDYMELPLHSSFVEERRDLLGALTDLSPDDWQRSAVVKQGGRERGKTLLFCVGQIALHEDAHCAQISEVLQGAA